MPNTPLKFQNLSNIPLKFENRQIPPGIIKVNQIASCSVYSAYFDDVAVNSIMAPANMAPRHMGVIDHDTLHREIID
jgi:hypothetical protein